MAEKQGGSQADEQGLSVADLGEDDLVSGMLARYGRLPAGVVVGPGDDAAVVEVAALVIPPAAAGPATGTIEKEAGAGTNAEAASRRRIVVSTDTLVEGYDFRRDWSSAREVGVKVAAQNFADIAAMGAHPMALLVSLATPSELPARWACDLADGLAEECGRVGAAVVGGDVSASREVVITGMAIGVIEGPVVLRSGARPGDVVALAGVTGPSAAGLALLSAGYATVGDPVLAGLVRDHLAPRPGYSAGPLAAAAGATALIDTSDGLLRDAARVATASGVVIDVDPAALAPGEALHRAAAVLGDPRAALIWVLSGGEDHALLACFPPDVSLPGGYRVIGRVQAIGSADAGPGEAAPESGSQVLVGGRPWSGPTGWTHFT